MAAFSWGLKSIEVQGPWPGVSRKDSREGYPSSSLRTNIQHITTLQFRVSSYSTVSFPLCRSSSWEFSLTNLCTQGSSLLHWTKQHLQAGQKQGSKRGLKSGKHFLMLPENFIFQHSNFWEGTNDCLHLKSLKSVSVKRLSQGVIKKRGDSLFPSPIRTPIVVLAYMASVNCDPPIVWIYGKFLKQRFHSF